MEGAGRAWLGVTVVNAVASWRGAAMAIREYIEAGVERGVCGEGLLCEALRLAGARGWRVSSTRSTLGFTGGVKSSSAVVNAALLAYYRAVGVPDPPPGWLVWVNAEAGLRSGVSVTGAADDAYASLLGGVAVVDNRERRLVGRHPPPRGVKVVLLRPRGLRRLWPPCRPELREHAKRMALRAWEAALEGDVFEAVRLNWEAYREYLCAPRGPVEEALKAGALAASLSGMGPVYEALAEPSRVEAIIDAWGRLGKVTVTEPAGEPACCLQG